MRAVKTAEQQLWERETTKSYVGLVGDPQFSDVMVDLVLSDSVARGNVALPQHRVVRVLCVRPLNC